GCVVAEPAGPIVATPPPAPPPAQVEVVPVTPGPAYVWVPGHWGWRGGGYVGVPGAYAITAQPGWGWVAPPWAPPPGGWVGVRGSGARAAAAGCGCRATGARADVTSADPRGLN